MINWKLVLSFYLTLFIPILYLVNISLAYFTAGSLNVPSFIVSFGLLLSLLGIVLWIISFYNLRKAFGVLPQKQKRIKTGLYKYTNHPMYIGIYITFLGLSFANKSLPGIIFLNLVILPLLLIRARLEDKNLED